LYILKMSNNTRSIIVLPKDLCEPRGPCAAHPRFFSSLSADDASRTHLASTRATARRTRHFESSTVHRSKCSCGKAVHQAGLDDYMLHSSRHHKLAKLGVGAANGKAESSNGFPDDDVVRPSIYTVRVWTKPLQLSRRFSTATRRGDRVEIQACGFRPGRGIRRKKEKSEQSRQ
jgi:hypothetical protein